MIRDKRAPRQQQENPSSICATPSRTSSSLQVQKVDVPVRIAICAALQQGLRHQQHKEISNQHPIWQISSAKLCNWERNSWVSVEFDYSSFLFCVFYFVLSTKFKHFFYAQTSKRAIRAIAKMTNGIVKIDCFFLLLYIYILFIVWNIFYFSNCNKIKHERNLNIFMLAWWRRF